MLSTSARMWHNPARSGVWLICRTELYQAIHTTRPNCTMQAQTVRFWLVFGLRRRESGMPSLTRTSTVTSSRAIAHWYIRTARAGNSKPGHHSLFRMGLMDCGRSSKRPPSISSSRMLLRPGTDRPEISCKCSRPQCPKLGECVTWSKARISVSRIVS